MAATEVMSRPSEESAGVTGWVFRWSADEDWRTPGADQSPCRIGSQFVHVTGDSLPEQSGDRRVHVVFSGTLYNRAELAASLGEAPRETCGNADVIHRAFRAWGDQCLSKLRGTFAVIVVDGEREQVLAARDPLGVFPLYWCRSGGTIRISMSMPALLACPGVSREIHREVVAERICLRWPKPEETYWRDLRRIPLGSALRCRRDASEVFRYWDPAPLDREVTWAKPEEVERFDAMLNAAVRRAMSHGRPGIFLSGGLDSVSVAAIAADQSQAADQPKPLALSVVFPDPSCNEEATQKSVAQALGLSQVLIPLGSAVGARGLLQAALELSADWPEPLFNPWLAAYQVLAREGRRQGCEVILTGNGGDEWLTTSPLYAADLISRLQFGRLWHLLRSHGRSFHESTLAIAWATLWRFGTRELLVNACKRGLNRYLPRIYDARWRWDFRHRLPAWFTADSQLRRVLEDRAAEAYGPPSVGSAYFRDSHLALEHPMMSFLMEENFESARRSGVQIAAPYWDPELVEFLYRVPPELLNQDGRSKGLIRSTLARRFPKLNFERHRKVVATGYFNSLVRKEGPAAWGHMGGLSGLAKLELVDRRSPALSAQAILNTAKASDMLFEVLVTESWVRRKLVSHSS